MNSGYSKITRIAIDAGGLPPLGRVRNGIQRLTNSFLLKLLESKSKVFINYYYFTTSRNRVFQASANLREHRLPSKFFGSVSLPINIIKDKNEVFLGFSGYLPRLLSRAKINKIIFVHDLGFIKFPQYYANPNKMKQDIEFSLKYADKIVVFSDFAKEELKQQYPEVPNSKIKRIYAGTDHLLEMPVLPQIKSDYFLYVGVIKPIKNILFLLAVFNQYVAKTKNTTTKLILVGDHEPIYLQEIINSSTYNKLKHRIIFKENVTDSEIVEYYSSARALLNFSLEEGFCYPVLEALRFGKVTIVNDLSLYQEYKKYFSNLLIGKNTSGLVKLMEQANMTKESKINLESKMFSWKSFTKQLLELF